MYSAFYRRSFLVVTIGVLGLLLISILRPLWNTVVWGTVLAFLLHPLHARLTRKLKGRAAASAGILTVLTPFLVVAPLGILGVVFAKQVAAMLETFRSSSLALQPYPQLLARLEAYPVIGSVLRWTHETAAISVEQVQSWLTEGAQTLLKSVASMGGSFALGVVGSLFGFVMMLFLLFFLLRDGKEMIERLTRLIPMEPEPRGKLLTYLGDVTRAVVFGSVATALVQGVFVGVGFAIVGLPSPVVFGVLATIAAFLPAGSAIVLAPAALYLMFTAHWGAAIFLAAWGGLMAIVENVLRPWLTSHRAHISTLAVFVGAIGGAEAFGILGLIIGPVLLGFIAALLKFAERGRVATA